MPLSVNLKDPGRKFTTVQQIATIILALAALAYCTKGFRHLLFQDPSDLHMKWIDEQYIFKGQNPFDVFLHHQDAAVGITQPRTTRNVQVDPVIGPPWAGGYPGWFYFPGLAIFWPRWSICKVIFAGLDVTALLLIAVCIRAEYRFLGRTTAWFLVACVLGSSAISNTISLGQYGILMMAMLLTALWAERHDHWFISGLCLALSTSKPTVGAVFVLAWIIKLRWKALIVAAVYLGIASATIGLQIKTSPLEMIAQMELTSRGYLHESYDLTAMLFSLGVRDVLASRIVGISCLILALAVMIYSRNKSLLFHCAVASVLGRLATYHHAYDNIMLIPLLLYCALAWLERGGVVLAINLGILGAMLWVPAKMLDPRSMQAAEVIVFPCALAVVLIEEHFARNTSGSRSLPSDLSDAAASG